MDVADFCRSAKVVMVAGKGGVGKTTVTAALALMAAKAGVQTLVVELDGKSGLPGLFGHTGPFGYQEVELISEPAPLRARRLTPDDALVEYLIDHGMARISKRLVSTGALDVVATAVPGLRDILVLGKIKQLEREDPAGMIVVDAPATGHALSALSTPAGLANAIEVGPIRLQAQDVIGLLSDKQRCQVVLVTLPEETPVNEVTEAAYRMEDTIGVKLGPIVVNGLYPEVPGLDSPPLEAATEAGIELTRDEASALEQAARFRAARSRLQEEQLDRLAAALPLPQLRLPQLFTTTIGGAELDILATELARQVEAL
jgi:anion-transporting  ArsA/GET3 family ATPase